MSEKITCPSAPTRSSAPKAISPSPDPTSRTVPPGATPARSRTSSRHWYKDSDSRRSRYPASPRCRTSSNHRCHRSPDMTHHPHTLSPILSDQPTPGPPHRQPRCRRATCRTGPPLSRSCRLSMAEGIGSGKSPDATLFTGRSSGSARLACGRPSMQRSASSHVLPDTCDVLQGWRGLPREGAAA